MPYLLEEETYTPDEPLRSCGHPLLDADPISHNPFQTLFRTKAGQQMRYKVFIRSDEGQRMRYAAKRRRR